MALLGAGENNLGAEADAENRFAGVKGFLECGVEIAFLKHCHGGSGMSHSRENNPIA